MSDSPPPESSETSTASPHRRRRRLSILIAIAIVLESIPIWLRGYKLPGNVVVRCREGHLFTTIWVPGASLKAVRLGAWRFQRCPVGGHWSFVTPVDRAELTADELRRAGEQRDIRVP